MITGNETITPQIKYRQEWEDRTDGDSLGLVNYTEGGITLKQHMVIEFSKAIVNAIYVNDNAGERFKRIDSKVNPIIVTISIDLANEIIKQLNDEK